MPPGASATRVPRFERDALGAGAVLTRIGDGEIGGKARGLLDAHDALRHEFHADGPDTLHVDIPALVVVTTDVFDAFLDRNGLRHLARSDQPDRRIAHAFQQGGIPPEFVGDLRALLEGVRRPLAVRSSSLLEDALGRPFAGVYRTKMTPNNQLDADARFRRLAEALKLVWASTFFAAPRRYLHATGRRPDDERMAVVIQEVVGRRHAARFYPDVSGVARSYNFYPSPNTRHEEGIVSLALGLGKTVVDGGVAWFYPPARPRTPPPFASARDQIRYTQTRFWAVNMGPPPEHNPSGETEYLVHCPLDHAERDGVLPLVASTYDAPSDRLRPGLHGDGPRVVNFAPLLSLDRHGFADAVRRLLAVAERALGAAAEIEFAMTAPDPPGARPRLRLLQARPMLVNDGHTRVTADELARSDVVLASSRVIGNGTDRSVADVVYARPDAFDPARTREIAAEIGRLDAHLRARDRGYLLIGFGRWGSSDPSLGIPVSWDQIAGARVIVEAALPAMDVEPSQGSHFFHNLMSFGVPYLMVARSDRPGVNWRWLDDRPADHETPLVRHVRLPRPLIVMVDGRSRLGVIRWTA